MFSYVSLEDRVPVDHPLREIRRITDRALERLSPRFDTLYIKFGRPSIPPEKLLRALVLQALYTIRSERQLIEQIDYNLLFRWFVGLGVDDAVWAPTTFTKNRDRLLDGDIAAAFFEAILQHADRERLLSDDPDFEPKATDVIGLYLNPPQHAAVFAADEKTAIQALDRLDPVLPLSPGRAGRHGFEYVRHGTLSLFAALNTQTGEVLGQTVPRHTSEAFVAFLGEIVASNAGVRFM